MSEGKRYWAEVTANVREFRIVYVSPYRTTTHHVVPRTHLLVERDGLRERTIDAIWRDNPYGLNTDHAAKLADAVIAALERGSGAEVAERGEEDR